MEPGDKILEFRLKDHNGNITSPHDFFQQYGLLILFVSSNDDLSMAYIGRLCKLIAKYEEDSFGVIIVDVNPEGNGYKRIIDCLEMENVHLSDDMDYLRLLHDDELFAGRIYNVKVTPEAFLFNPDRELVYHGPIDDGGVHSAVVTRVYLEDAIEYMLDGLEIDYPEIELYGTPVDYPASQTPKSGKN